MWQLKALCSYWITRGLVHSPAPPRWRAEEKMKIVVIGGTGLIGSKTIRLLRSAGHDALAAAPDTGVNTVTGEGLETILDGAAVVIDLANSRSLSPRPRWTFLRRTRRTFLPQKRA